MTRGEYELARHPVASVFKLSWVLNEPLLLPLRRDMAEDGRNCLDSPKMVDATFPTRPSPANGLVQSLPNSANVLSTAGWDDVQTLICSGHFLISDTSPVLHSPPNFHHSDASHGQPGVDVGA
ncbi:hypothetical protein CIHG_01265 [Coccidioides immitis H538.4]|uniref:Uncharacterized protein n=3 Tax=Coccidioides immitis TaxID=5501 RepID=A0A0J8QK42_COCIT|nr:hypothetical protein CIRG_01115 [Coccidioides immitis RMSCC 2394]KMU72789.1 hypothetical protein CISG_03224 [Coccidioides immitis RMSCC 3703]KMU83483.1 hypothetical protein CIHG_01265 [Coccidioides immitis H538.4]